MSKKTTKTTAAKPVNLPAVAETGGDVVNYEDILAARAAKAKAQTARMPSGGGVQGLSFRGGKMSWAGQDVGNLTSVIILAWIPERTYYDRPYNADDKSPPTCYSYGEDTPHPKAHQPQAKDCEGCIHNEWSSANVGKGKACKEGARLILIPADTEDFEAVQLTTARVSTLNAKYLVDYVNALDARKTSVERVVTDLSCTPDPKSQYRLGFKATGVFKPTKGAATSAFLALLARADAEISKPYPGPREDDKPAHNQRTTRASRR